VAVISDRIWAVDAERPARVYYTKPKEPGIFPEFNPSEMFIDLPASAGEITAIASFRDAPLFLTTTGVWTVAGDGPDALLNPPLFSAPQQISDVPCTSAASVVLSPVGLLYKSNDRYALFSGQSTIFPNFAATGTVTNTAVFRNQQEVIFFLSNGLIHVYNYQMNAWTYWGTDTTNVTDAVAVAQETVNGSVLYFSSTVGDLVRLNPSSVSSTAQIQLESGWILCGGPQDDNSLANLVLHSRSGGTHGLQMTIATDYGTSQPTKTWTAAEVTTASANTKCDLYPEPKDMPARAVKVTLLETGGTGEGFQPVNLTLEVLKNGGKMTRSLKPAGRK
jgi:hypothetical protein